MTACWYWPGTDTFSFCVAAAWSGLEPREHLGTLQPWCPAVLCKAQFHAQCQGPPCSPGDLGTAMPAGLRTPKNPVCCFMPLHLMWEETCSYSHKANMSQLLDFPAMKREHEKIFCSGNKSVG